MNWNILVIKGKEIKRDSVSSGERKWKKQEKLIILIEKTLEGKVL